LVALSNKLGFKTKIIKNDFLEDIALVISILW